MCKKLCGATLIPAKPSKRREDQTKSHSADHDADCCDGANCEPRSEPVTVIMDSHDDDDGLWNELSHQQSREIEQHHARTSGHNPTVAKIHRMAQQTATEVSRVANTFYQAASEAYQEHVHQQRQHYYHRAPTTTTTPRSTDTYLDDFGIPKEEPLLDDFQTEYTSLDQQQHQQNDFVFLPQFRFRPTPEGWGAVANLDLYFSSLYSYYYRRGLVPIIGKGVVELVTLFFTLFLSVFLFAYVDWKALSTCTDESTCHSQFTKAYLIHHPFSHWSLWNFNVILYCLLFLAYGLFSAWSFVHTVQDALRAKFVFEERLGITARKLEGGAVEWDRDVVNKLLQLQESGEYRIAIHGQDLDALVVAQRILRKENFLMALFNRGLLDLSVPFLNQQFFCASLEWSLHFCILNFMFNHKYQIRPAFYLDPSALQRRFMLCGIAHAIFMPFLLLFLTLHFGLQNAYDWKNTKRYLGPREWSLSAKWIFREFNELQHNFERRLSPSYEAAEGYLKLFGSNEIIAALGRILVFIGGSLGAVLFVFAAMNDAILLHVKIADWNLLWYVGVVGVLYSGGKAMIPTGEAQPRHTRNIFAEINDALSNVASHTHYYPETWKGRGWDQATHKAVSSMFKYKAQLFAMEVASVVLSPYILCVSLAKCAGPICEFVLAVRAEVPGAGDVCGFATFDFDKYEDETWEGRTLGSTDPLAGTLTESIMHTGNVDEATRRFPKPKARHGKMEKSFFSFKAAHPTWKCNPSGQNLVDRVEEYQRQETAALHREQQLHVEAAARQLETLAQLEQRSNEERPTIAVVDDSYIPRRSEAPADAGAGVFPPSPPREPPQPPFAPQQDPSTPSPHSPQSNFGPPLPAVHEEPSPPFAVPTEPLPPRPSSSSTLTGIPTHRPSSSSTLTPGNRSSISAALNLGLSSELRRILNMSTLDPDVSVAGSLLAGDVSAEDEERRAERQYLWLERYHAHVAAQQRQMQESTMSEPVRAPRENGESDPPTAGSHIV